MKYIKYAVFFLATILIYSCEEEEILSYALQEISAPANVSATFNITQDDTGLVTITPTGEGASAFKVFFGDDPNEIGIDIEPGGSVDHTYTEGQYDVRVIATGATGLTSEFARTITISFRVPEDLEDGLVQNALNPAMITITPSAEFAMMFDIYFGEDSGTEPDTTIVAGDPATHTYSNPGTYRVRIVAKGAGVQTSEIIVIVTVPDPSTPVGLPISWDDPTVEYAPALEGSFTVIDNPQLSGINATPSMVGALENAGQQWEAGVINLLDPVDFSGDDKIIKMKLYADVPVPILLKFEGGVNDERQNEISLNHGGTGWEELIFNFATDAVKSYIDGSQGVGEPFVPTGQYTKMVIFVDGPGTTAGTFYFDDIEQTLPPVELPITWDESTIDYAAALVGSFTVIDNPQMNGINAGATKVGAIANAGQQWEAGVINLGTAVDFSGDDKTIQMKLYADVAVPILLKFEGGVNDERQNEITVNHGGTGWEELNFDFATDAVKSYIDGSQGVGEPFVPTGQYATMVIFVDGPGFTAGNFYLDDIEQTGGEPIPVVELPITWDDPAVNYASALAGSFTVIDNPQMNGINPGATKVGAIANAGQQWEAGVITLGNPVDFSGNDKVIKMKLYADVAVPILLKFEGGVNGERQNEITVNHGGTGWEELSFNYATDAVKSYIDGNQGVGEPFVPTGLYATIVIFVDGPGFTAGNFYFDDIEQTEPPVELPITWDDPTLDYAAVLAGAFTVTDNPFLSGTNPLASKVGLITNAGQQWEAGVISLGNAVDFSGMNKTISMKFYADVSVPILLKFEGGVNGERQNEITLTHGGTGWEDLNFNFATDAVKSYIDGNQGVGEPFVPTGQYKTIVIFVDGPGFTAGNFYLDDITQQ